MGIPGKPLIDLHIGGNRWTAEVCEKTGQWGAKCGDQLKEVSFWSQVEKVNA